MSMTPDTALSNRPPCDRELCARLEAPLREAVQAVVVFQNIENGEQLLRDVLPSFAMEETSPGRKPAPEEIGEFLEQSISNHVGDSQDIYCHWPTRELDLMIAYFLTCLRWYIAEGKMEMLKGMESSVRVMIAFCGK